MAIALTTIGAVVSYGSDMTTGTFTKIPGITEIPEMNPTPEMLDTTSLDNTVYTTGVPGLKTLDTLAFGARFSKELFELMETVAKLEKVYIQITIPGLTKSCFIECKPVPLGLPSASANSVIDCSIYFTPVGEPTWSDTKKPTT